MQSLLPIIILALYSTLSSLADESSSYQPYTDCAMERLICGNLSINVSYPFRLSTRLDACGYPDFLLRCVNNSISMVIINIGNYGYQVKNIDYLNHLLTVVDTNLTAQSCPQPYKNTTLVPSLYKYTDRDQNLTLFINCTAPPTSFSTTPLYDIGCLSDLTLSRRRYSYFTPSNRSLARISENCSSTIVVPVNMTAADLMVNGELDFGAGLEEGFTVRWLPGTGWCRNCINSGGICGYNYSFPLPQDPTCFCPYGLARGTCLPSIPGSHTTRNIIIGVCVGVAALFAGCCFCFLWYQRRKRQQRSNTSNLLSSTASSKPSSIKDPELGTHNYNTHVFSYEELQEATNGFDASRELGDGGFGTVYKGTLRDGRVVAVKRLYENNYKRVEQFVNEVLILSGLRHQNLVTLYGCTSHHSRELLLVYEFVPNGTVADHLHGLRATEGALTWAIRLNIAIETASALAYLHAIEPQIIHRDVKTNNILLDKGFHVKVADFGLSRLFPVHATHVSTLPQGTPGYVDPEYHQCYQLTDKSDVYSFGVVLVELISSKPAVDISRHRHEINLANMAIVKIQNNEWDQLIDPGLGYQADWEMERMIKSVAELAFRCLQGDRNMRPSIKEVMEELKTIQSRGEKEEVEADVKTTEDTGLLKNTLPYSPDSVTKPWESTSTTPNTSS